MDDAHNRIIIIKLPPPRASKAAGRPCAACAAFAKPPVAHGVAPAVNFKAVVFAASLVFFPMRAERPPRGQPGLRARGPLRARPAPALDEIMQDAEIAARARVVTMRGTGIKKISCKGDDDGAKAPKTAPARDARGANQRH
ncbi:hypothetical protein [Methylocella sp.]|uniref:hypothetical protein n=1 Tax=Methylocella sp. TaxID=1978226 RepID=UPI003784DC24